MTYILWFSDSASIHSILFDEQALFFWKLVQCDMGHWPVFHDLAILNHLPISAYSSLLKFDMKIFVNVARLEFL